MIYRISKSFNTRVQRTDRVLEIAEAFGIGLADSTFVIYDDFEIAIDDGDLVYISGQSGSGKSLLLRELSRQMAEQGKKVGNIDEVELVDAPLIDQIGASTNEAIRLMSAAGINDAYLYVRTPQELSDGQKYRFRLAKLIEQKCDVWVADEFGAILDRVTAKGVAYSLQKTARARGVTTLIATTHLDLLDDFNPRYFIEKRYQDLIDVRKFEVGE